MAEIQIEKDLQGLNDDIAAENRSYFSEHDIFVMNIMGSPGSGKTTLLENILPKLSAFFRIAVIEGDLATQNDAERIRKLGITALQINTKGACHLDARMIWEELKKLDPDSIDFLMIENVGNLVCPVSFDLGENLRMVVLSTPEGEDKPLKYPPAMLNTDAVVITKTDLTQYVGVNLETMKKYILEINPKARILDAGKINGVYFADSVIRYIKDKAKAK